MASLPAAAAARLAAQAFAFPAKPPSSSFSPAAAALPQAAAFPAIAVVVAQGLWRAQPKPPAAAGAGSEQRETILLPGCDYNHWLIVIHASRPRRRWRTSSYKRRRHEEGGTQVSDTCPICVRYVSDFVFVFFRDCNFRHAEDTYPSCVGAVSVSDTVSDTDTAPCWRVGASEATSVAREAAAPQPAYSVYTSNPGYQGGYAYTYLPPLPPPSGSYHPGSGADNPRRGYY